MFCIAKTLSKGLKRFLASSAWHRWLKEPTMMSVRINLHLNLSAYHLYSQICTKFQLPFLGKNYIQSICTLIKFIYSEKATKFSEIFPLLLTTVHTVKSNGKSLQNFVAFSEYMNFNKLVLNEHEWSPKSWRIKLVSFKTFIIIII
jgi:hypothetical protein